MRVVVMDREMSEPLTVVEIPASLMREVQNGRRWLKLPVPESMMDWFTLRDMIPNVAETFTLRVVHLNMEPIRTGDGRGGSRVSFWTATPDDEELALLLRAAFLPGQVTELRRREAQAWFHGAIGAGPPG